jgi:hypothetical protein
MLEGRAVGESIRAGYWRPTFTGREPETRPARLGNVGRLGGGRIHPGGVLETHVHTGESLKRDLQDLAMLEGRAVGEYIRAVLETHTYGAKAKLLSFRPQDQAQTAP